MVQLLIIWTDGSDYDGTYGWNYDGTCGSDYDGTYGWNYDGTDGSDYDGTDGSGYGKNMVMILEGLWSF